jgi:transcriptional regulator with XRE-family HTH domain
MEGRGLGGRILYVRRLKMWTQGTLARKAGVSPTTVSGIESGKISRPHFGTLQKLARALEVEPEELLASGGERLQGFTLRWALSAQEEEFERELEEASLESLSSLARELSREQERLLRLYGEFPPRSEQRRFIKRQIRAVAARSESVRVSILFHDSAGPAAAGGAEAPARSSGPG